MRGGDHVLYAILRCDAAHSLGRFPGLRAIVHLRQDVAVNVDHVFAI
jgi:hypothetical protein